MRRFAILIFLSSSFCWAQESGSFQPVYDECLGSGVSAG